MREANENYRRVFSLGSIKNLRKAHALRNRWPRDAHSSFGLHINGHTFRRSSAVFKETHASQVRSPLLFFSSFKSLVGTTFIVLCSLRCSLKVFPCVYDLEK